MWKRENNKVSFATFTGQKFPARDSVEVVLCREPANWPTCDLKFMIKQLFQPCNNNKIKPACVGLGKARVSHRRCGLPRWAEVREPVLTQVMFSIKTPLLTRCDNSSSFVRSLGIKLYNSALPFSPAYCGSQHLLLLAMAVPGLQKPFPICQPTLTFRVGQVIWQVGREVGKGG